MTQENHKKALHGEVKARIYRNLLLHKTFTVAQLTADTGLLPYQIYPVLAKLRQGGFLSGQSEGAKNLTEKKGRAAHRPNQLYTLTDDPEKYKRLAAEIAPFLKLSPGALSHNPALERVKNRMSELADSVEAIPISLDKIGIDYLQASVAEIRRIRKGLLELKDDLEVAWYECNRSKETIWSSKCGEVQRHFDKLQNRLEGISYRVETELERLNAEEEFSRVMSRSFPPGRHLSCLQVVSVLRQEYDNANNFFLKKILSEVAARVTFAGASPGNLPVAYALAEACARFGSDAQLFFAWSQDLRSLEVDNAITLYNLANSAVLAGNEAEAFNCWQQVLLVRHRQASGLFGQANDLFGPLKHLSVYRGAILVSGDLGQLGRYRFQELENQTGLQGAFSLTSTSPVDELGMSAYVIKPTLADWFGPESSGFVLSAMMRKKQEDFFAYGPICDIVSFPGLPRIRLATALVRVGVKVDVAWRVAETLKAGKVVIVIHIPKAADNSVLDGIKGALPGFEVEGSFSTEGSKQAVKAA